MSFCATFAQIITKYFFLVLSCDPPDTGLGWHSNFKNGSVVFSVYTLLLNIIYLTNYKRRLYIRS